MIKEGDKLPTFELTTEAGAPVSSKDFAGRRAVIFIYPRANTPG